MDSVLTPEAKAIYAYLASFAGAGESCFPTRAKILSDLSIGKDVYKRQRSENRYAYPLGLFPGTKRYGNRNGDRESKL